MAKVRRASKVRKVPQPKPAPAQNGTVAVAAGVVDLVTRTAATALSGVRDVGVEVGSVAVTAVRGSVQAVGEIGADVGRLAAGAAEGAISAADRIAVTAGKAVGNLVSSTVESVREIMYGAAPRRPAPLKARQPSRGSTTSRQVTARRKPLAPRPSRTAERARRRSTRAADSA